MLIDIKDIAREDGIFEKPIPIGRLRWEGDETIPVGPTKLAGPLRAVRGGIEFDGHLSSTLTLQCVRCLEQFELEVISDFYLLFVPRLPETRPGEAQVHEEDCDLYPAPEGRVDMAAVAREQLTLAVPPKPLCREDCRGLCPRCGENRNLVDCDCAGEKTELRNSLTIPFSPRRPAQ